MFEKLHSNFKPWKLARLFMFMFLTCVEGLRFHIWSGTAVNVQANLKKGPTGCPVTSAIILQPVVRNITEELRPQLTDRL